MTIKTAAKPRLKNLDDLFLLNGGENPLEQQDNTVRHPAQRQHSTLAIADLIPFSKHPFRLYEGERLSDMVESIRQHGVLIPILVRRTKDCLEILSGHNRVNAAKLAGLEKVPGIVMENISDDEAWIYVIETNLMQRSFSEMRHSEKAAVIAMYHSKLFSQGKRNDIIRELKRLENPNQDEDYTTSAQSEQKLTSRDFVAQAYGLDRNTVARYLRVFQLTANLKLRLDAGEIGFIASVTLSFLSEQEQFELDKCIELNRFKVDGKKANLLREYSENRNLDEEKIYLILSGEIGKKPKPNRTPTVKVSKKIYTQYFRPEQSPKEIQAIVEKALSLYFSQTTI